MGGSFHVSRLSKGQRDTPRSQHQGGPLPVSAYPQPRRFVETLRHCFRIEVFRTFQILLAGRIDCVDPHTISEFWQATGLAAKLHHDSAYATFHSAACEWVDLGMVLATLVMTHLIPGSVFRLLVDDTLCHKRGAKVAFGSIFLDAVLSSKRHKTLPFGLNWVVLDIAHLLPFRKNRYFCMPMLWQLYRLKAIPEHQSLPVAAAELARKLAEPNPHRIIWLVVDSAYVYSAILCTRPDTLEVIGPVLWKAALLALHEPPRGESAGSSTQEGRPIADSHYDYRRRRQLPSRTSDDPIPQAGSRAANPGNPGHALVCSSFILMSASIVMHVFPSAPSRRSFMKAMCRRNGRISWP